MSKNNATGNVREEIRSEFGYTNIDDSKETIKTPLLTFSDSNVYLGLKIVSKYDPLTGIRKEPTPRITMSINGKYVEVPHNGKWWKEFSEFTVKMARAMEGVDLSTSRIEADVDYATRAMAKYRNKAA